MVEEDDDRREVIDNLIAKERWGEAAARLQVQADEGVAWALGGLGSLYYCGRGVECSGTLAERYLRAAAEAGDALACHNLSTLFITGAPGVEPDAEAAAYWAGLAKERGFPPWGSDARSEIDSGA